MLLLLAVVALLAVPLDALAQRRDRASQPGPAAEFSQIVGRPADRSATISLLAATELDAFIEHGSEPGRYDAKTPVQTLKPGEPREFELTGLQPDAPCYYRVRTRDARTAHEFAQRPECSLHTQRKRGSTFSFAVQGDSHPERPGRMYDADLYIQTMNNVAKGSPDFYFLMGDDFSIERLIERKTLEQSAVDAVYAGQRGFLDRVGRSAAIMLVNGNHEQAAKYLLDGTADNFAVMAGRARTRFFPLPGPDTAGSVYTGNAEPVEHIGLLRDYYAWEWGDALFVVIDPYWHSDVAVDNEAGVKAPGPGDGPRNDKPRQRQRPGADNQPQPAAEPGDGPVRRGKGNRDLWQITLGETQYRWLARTLGQSKAPFKFVFSHHVSGTGRGGVEVAGRYEWGGEDRRGIDRFFQMRPTWEKPIHDLMRDTGVTIFFQGHDHLYARQELDGVIYQTVPNPADPTFTAFNREAYRSGDILPNSGHLRVTVSAESARVEYIRSFRPQDEQADRTNGSLAHEYTLTPRPARPPTGEQR